MKFMMFVFNTVLNCSITANCEINFNISVEIETCLACNLGFVTVYVNADHKRQSRVYAPRLTERKRDVRFLRVGTSLSIASKNSGIP